MKRKGEPMFRETGGGLFRTYDAADASAPRATLDGGWFIALRTVQLGRLHLYRMDVQRKCRACRRLPWQSRWSGARTCGCGNPYVNEAKGAGTERSDQRRRWLSARKAEQERAWLLDWQKRSGRPAWQGAQP